MSLWDLAGVHGLNKYIWSILQSDLGWSAANYGGLTPITTPQQEPEFNALDQPYIVYTYAKSDTGDDWWLESEMVAYTIFSQSEKDIRQATNLLFSRLNQRDTSAQIVNDYISASGSDDNKAFDYKAIAVTSLQGAQPSLQEGGRYDGLVVVKYAYTHYSPVTGESIRY